MSAELFEYIRGRSVEATIYDSPDHVPDFSVVGWLLDESRGGASVYPARRPGGVTVVEAMGVWKLSRAATNRRLREMVRNGQAIAETTLIDGTVTKVYYPLDVENGRE